MRVTLGQATRLVKGNWLQNRPGVLLLPGFLQTLGSQTTQEPGSGTGSGHNASLFCRLIRYSGRPDKALLFTCSHSAGNLRWLLIWGPPSTSLVSAPPEQTPSISLVWAPL